MSNDAENDKAKKAIIGFLTTLAVAVVTRLVTALLESDSVANAVSYVSTNFPFLFTALVTAISGGYFAQKWTRNC